MAQNHSKCLLMAHVVWSTDFRIRVLNRGLEPWLRNTMKAKAAELGCALLGIGIADNHVHALVRFPPTVTLADLVQRLKGATSYECNRRRRLSRRLVWQRGYWAATVSRDAVEPLIAYFATQREHHACRPMAVLYGMSDRPCDRPRA